MSLPISSEIELSEEENVNEREDIQMGGHAGSIHSFESSVYRKEETSYAMNRDQPTAIDYGADTIPGTRTKQRRFTREGEKRKTDSESGGGRDQSRHGKSNRARNVDTWTWRGTTERTKQSG